MNIWINEVFHIGKCVICVLNYKWIVIEKFLFFQLPNLKVEVLDFGEERKLSAEKTKRTKICETIISRKEIKKYKRDMFPSSTQRKHWMLGSEAKVIDRRLKAYNDFIARFSYDKSQSAKYLAFEECELILRFFEKKLADFCNKFRPHMPR